ncbi:hypothetical protein ACFP2T_47610 [Plantactinospora solaniradicis]|uniref:Uncharacterized protein n=1 Tax=Plantactinospora solaniradicis TaxID=1723736 RepID=A0ABW1KT94_9ACTN
MRASGLFAPATAERPTPAEEVGTRSFDLLSYALGVVPLLVPIVAITLMGDPAVLRVVLWQGNLVALFIATLQPFLPLVLGVTTFVVVRRSLRKSLRSAALLSIPPALALLFFVPVGLALVELGIAAALWTAVWWHGHGQPVRRPYLIAGLVLALCGTVAPVLLLWNHGMQTGSQLIAPRTLYGLPREVAVEKDGTVWVYYLVSSDERFTTVITGTPRGVRNIRTQDVTDRLPCRHRESTAGRSLHGHLVGEANGGTAYCGDLASCLRAVPQPTARHERTVIDGCIREAKLRVP